MANLKKVTENNHLPAKGNDRFPVYSKQFNDLVDTLTDSSGDLSVGVLNYKAQVTDTGGAFATPVVLTTAQSGRLVLVDDAAGLDFKLPAIAAGDVGTWFEFLVTVTITSNSFKVTAAAGDLLNGGVLAIDFDAA